MCRSAVHIAVNTTSTSIYRSQKYTFTMSLCIDLSPAQDDITPTPASSNIVLPAPHIAEDFIPSEAAPFISLFQSTRRAKAALPEETIRVIETGGSTSFPSTGGRREMDDMDGGFGSDVKRCESKRSGMMGDMQGLALTFDEIPDRFVPLVSFIYNS